jgi:hypothetical protein
MASSGRPRKANNVRHIRLGLLHARVAKAKITDDDYRNRLEREFNVRSARDLTDRQLDRALELFHVKPSAGGAHPHLRKVRALWIALANLGEVDPSDAALDAFVERQSGKQRLTFLTPVDTGAVVEALKAMCARAGFVIPANDAHGMEARRALIRAQWTKLRDLDPPLAGRAAAIRDDIVDLMANGDIASLDRRQLDDAARILGRLLRKHAAKRNGAAA